MSVFLTEIPGQDHDGYDAEPNFFRECKKLRTHPRTGRLKRLRLAVMRSEMNLTPAPAPPTTPPSVATATTFKTHLQHLFTRLPHHAMPPVVDVPFAQGKERNAAAGPKDVDDDLMKTIMDLLHRIPIYNSNSNR
ncbi:hypothetical protein EV702DRAFT_1197724 [Suillus placidus]|uniref:Uncharacterized protein n=1 Tax=Suillus placidus TaxID=48579 RepID=A0A9P6ZVK5_9AGAM|nr:hypothetical protein EV702DRAFT_1197724 [Suillus placidus]